MAGRRVLDGAWSVGQCAVAAGIAWTAARSAFDHPRPFFASAAAVVCLGLRPVQRLRRVLELAVGVTVGVAVGQALVSLVGQGAWQITLVIAVAMLVALAVDGGPMVTAQAGLQAVFVVAFPAIPGQDLARWEDAMVGGVTALVVAALLPADPWRPALRARRSVLTEVGAALRQCADAVRRADPATAAFALAAMRGTQAGMTAWSDAVTSGLEVRRLTPLRRRSRAHWDDEARLAASADRAVRNLRVLVRRVLFALGSADPLPPSLPELLDDLAALGDRLGEEPESVVGELVDYAVRLDPDALGVSGLSETVVVAQLRSALVDLLEGLGVDPDRARATLPAA